MSVAFDQKKLEQLSPLTLRQVHDLAPPRWRIADLLPQEALVVLFGLPKTLKSFVAIDWGLSISRGEAWLGHVTAACDVVYVAAEGVGGLGRRCAAWLSARKLTFEDAPQFRAVRCPVNMTEGTEVAHLVQAVNASALRPGLIVLDTVSRCFGGKDTNQQQDMSRFVAGCDALRTSFPGATVLAVHHCAKSNSGDWPLGSVALPGAADAMFMTERPKEHGSQLTVRNTAQKDADEHRDIHLLLTPEGESCVLRPDSERAPSERSTDGTRARRSKPTDDAVFAALMTRLGGAASLKEWELAAGKPHSTFMEARKRLMGAGLVKHNATTGHYLAEVPPNSAPTATV